MLDSTLLTRILSARQKRSTEPMRYSLLSDTNNWMSAIDDDKSLAHISIPGTHDSCAREGASNAWTAAWITTQYKNATISQQLSDGIRYLDMRCSVSDGAFAIYHDEYDLHISFGDVLEQCISFLKEHSSEAIIMRIKQENSEVSDEEFQKVFNETYANYHDNMYLEAEVPGLGKVRGKIVIISNVDSIPGIEWDSIYHQDDWKNTNVLSKLSEVITHVQESVVSNKRGSNTSDIYLNHCSAMYTYFVTPSRFAAQLLFYLKQKFIEGLGSDLVDNAENEAAHIGIIAMDFYDNKIVAEIIKRNDNRDFQNLSIEFIYSSRYGKHYLYALTDTDSGQNSRLVGCVPDNKVNNSYWILISYNEDESQYYIFNTYYKEFLHASNITIDNRRDVYTRINGVPTNESIWTIKSDTIHNEYYKCYLYKIPHELSPDRKTVACWAPGKSVVQSHWKRERV